MTRGITLVEMLIAMAITLLMMAAVVTLFANISSSVSKRRATIEMSTQMQQVRAMLQRDLAGATCPAVPWQRPESNHGYIELIEGAQSDANPSPWIVDSNDSDSEPDGVGSLAGIDLTISSLPSSNLGRMVGSEQPVASGAATDGRGLGDGDDILMLTVRNEKEPFVGRAPTGVYSNGSTNNTPGPFERWNYQSIESQFAEVVWYAIENPPSGTTPGTFYFGEPGYRTIYRRTLMIAPQLNFSFLISANGQQVTTGPGVLRVLDSDIAIDEVDQALAALIAFQERYDISARVEWDALLPGSNNGRWKIVANTLGDLTKRENRYEHHGWGEDVAVANISQNSERKFPYAVASIGAGYAAGNMPLALIVDGEFNTPSSQPIAQALLSSVGVSVGVMATNITTAIQPNRSDRYSIRPFVRSANVNSSTPFALRAIIDENGSLVYVTRGIAPLGNSRRGEDVVMTDALAFDVRVFDPGAPLYDYNPDFASNAPALTVLQPGDPAWINAYNFDLSTNPLTTGTPGTGNVGNPTTNNPFTYAGQGAYVDLGYGYAVTNAKRFFTTYSSVVSAVAPKFFEAVALTDPVRKANYLTSTDLAPGYSVYDTWSHHYENDGVNEDGDVDQNGVAMIDEFTNGFDDRDPSLAGVLTAVDNVADIARFGVDDPTERETTPPYDTSLRGMQVTLRGYERDSRQIREVKVRQTFVPK